MPAIQVSGQLNLVNRDELGVEIERHGLDGAEEIARMRRDVLFLARDERHRLRAAERDHAVVDLPREKAQREPDHPGSVGEHALDRHVGLARVGRAEQGSDAR